MQITNPCKKCIVRACCTAICEPSFKWNKKVHSIIYEYTPIGMFISMVKDKDWMLLFLMVAEIFLMITYLILDIRGVQ